jgi:succinylglutamic semialdehyde dehydrogenase
MSGSLFINGEWVKGAGSLFSSINPVTNKNIWSGKAATSNDVDEAIVAARTAFADWGFRDAEDRVAILKKFAALLVENKDHLANCIMRETGKAHWDALGEAGAMAAKLDISLKAYTERTGSRASINGAIKAGLTHRPHGVMAIFGPYNFPGHLPNGHILPALLAGNTVVFKPSELTPMVAEETVKLWQQAGLPDGVLNLVQGGRETGMALTAHDGIDGVLFTGSVPTGQAIARSLADKPHVVLALELGGNNPLIVHDVADLDAAAVMTIQSAFVTSGQRCTCARRLIVPTGKAGDDFIDRLIDFIQHIEISIPTHDPQPFMASLISVAAAKAVLGAQTDLLAKGAKALIAAKQSHLGGAFVSPGLLDVTGIDNVPDDEVFGPLLQVIRVDNFDTAIEEANNTRFGLAAGVITDNVGLQQQFYKSIRAGIVNWNQPLTGASSAAPFGGIGLSGNNKPSAYYAADYCSWPMASLDSVEGPLVMPTLPNGIIIPND